jgi:plasmid replication initiation protein
VTTPFLPERHPMRDFFVLDTLDVVPRTDMASMEHPIFSLSTKADTSLITYENAGARVEIIPSTIGLPTVFDKDILIYCISKLVHMRNEGRAIGPCVRLTTHDMLVETNRPTNNLGYERLLPALNRLRGVVINTTITTGKQMTTRGFGLIDEFEYNRKGSMFAERLRYLEIKLSDWLFRAVEAAEVLPISRYYFRLRRPIDRRLYEVARKHCGKQASWKIGTELLQKKCGSRQQAKHFAAHLREVVKSNHLPDYDLTLEGGLAQFRRRREGAVTGQPITLPTGRATTPPRILISGTAMEQLRAIAPGWDRHMLEATYKEWVWDKDAARNEDARFLGWARSFTKGKPP